MAHFKIGKVRRWLGLPGAILVAVLVVTLAGSIGAIVLAPASMVPLVGLIALLFAPFPTAFVYMAAALILFVPLRLLLRALPQPAAQWAASALALIAVWSVGWGVAKYMNTAAGLRASPSPIRPQAVDLPRGQPIALIAEGSPEHLTCGTLCLSLLLQGQASTVTVGASDREPGALETVRGKQFSLTDKTRSCLRGMRSYSALATLDPEFRRKQFVAFEGVPDEYATCLAQNLVTIDPARQVTLVEWTSGDQPGENSKPGYSSGIALLRTVVPVDGQPPKIQQARYRSGRKYVEPLFLSPYDGNASTGGHFSPSLAMLYFEDSGFPDSFTTRWWGLLRNSQALGLSTAAWLDTVVAPPTN